MDTHELRKLDPAALQAEVKNLQHEYFAVLETVRVGKEKNHARLKTLRRGIARATTILKEQQVRATDLRKE